MKKGRETKPCNSIPDKPSHSIPMPEVKPPLGIMPQKYWLDKVRSERVIELNNAMIRYFEANKEIPIEWVKERNELINKI